MKVGTAQERQARLRGLSRSSEGGRGEFLGTHIKAVAVAAEAVVVGRLDLWLAPRLLPECIVGVVSCSRQGVRETNR